MKIEDVKALITKIATSGGFTDDMLEDIKKLQNEFDERIGMEEGKAKEPPLGYRTWYEAYEDVYKEKEEIKKRYVERFLNGDKNSQIKIDKTPDSGDTSEDLEKYSFENLFRNEEK